VGDLSPCSKLGLQSGPSQGPCKGWIVCPNSARVDPPRVARNICLIPRHYSSALLRRGRGCGREEGVLAKGTKDMLLHSRSRRPALQAPQRRALNSKCFASAQIPQSINTRRFVRRCVSVSVAQFVRWGSRAGSYPAGSFDCLNHMQAPLLKNFQHAIKYLRKGQKND